MADLEDDTATIRDRLEELGLLNWRSRPRSPIRATKKITLRIAEHELEEFRRRAAEARKTLTDYILDAALGKE